MRPDAFLWNMWTDILGTGGRFPPEHLDTFPGIRTLRGKIKVTIQWLLYCMIHNIEKIVHYGANYGVT
jgi:hypothetical protein